MNIMLDEGKVSDFLGKANDALFKAYNKYQYLKGAQDSERIYNKKAFKSDLPKSVDGVKLPSQIVTKGDVKYIGKDELNGYIKISFDARDVSDDMKLLIDPEPRTKSGRKSTSSKGSALFNYITDYDNGIITMELPMDGYDRRNMTTKVKDAANKFKDKVGTFMKSENVQINESVSWGYFDKYDPIMDEYLPASGEGETMASQIVTAVAKLVYKWYNDGDVFDNTHYLQGWANDLSSYANWLYMNVPKCNLILDTIENIKTEGEYEDLLQKLTDYCFSDEVLNKFKDKEKKGSIYSAVGPYSFKDYEDEDEDWDDYEYEDEEWDESLTLREGDSKTSDYKFVYSTPSGRLSFEYIDASDDDDAMNKFREIHPYNVILKWGPNPHKNQNEELELKEESDIDLSDFYTEGDWSAELDDYYDEVEYARDNHPADKTIVPKLSKTVMDSDGFTTDYVLYYDTENDKWICIFGDRDVYTPYNTEPDYETDSREDAYEWFDSYEGITESVMTPTPIPYKRNKEEELELELKESSTQHNYRVTFFDKSINDYKDTIVTADSAKDAANKFREINHGEILEIKNDSFTNPKTYYKQGWNSVREEELELAIEESETPLNLAVTSYQTGEWLNPEDFDNFEDYDEYYSYYDMGPENFYKEYKDIVDFSPEFIAQYSNDLQEDTSIETNEKAIKVINDVYNEKGDIDSDESIAEIEKRIKQQGITMDADSLGDILIKSAEMIDTLGESLSNKDANKLEKELRAKIKEVFLSKFGFEEDDWNEYSYLKVTNPFINSEGDKGTKIEVRAEVNYNDLMYLARELDKIITKYDEYAYFEPVTPGIMEAYIWDGYNLGESLTEGLLDSVAYIDLDNAEATENPEEYVEYLINHELKLDKVKGAFKTAIKPIFFKAIKYLNTFKDIISNFQQRGNVFYIDYKRPVTEGKKVSFKDHHICQGCGNPLSKCTCEIEGLDFSGGTQVSNIGQHKVDKLDMIEENYDNKTEILDAIADELKLNDYTKEVLIHDVNNLRGDEWVKVIKTSCSPELVAKFMKLIK